MSLGFSFLFFVAGSVFVMIVSFMPNCLAQTEREDDPQDLDCDDPDRHSDHDVQIADDVVVDGSVTALEEKGTLLHQVTELYIKKPNSRNLYI